MCNAINSALVSTCAAKYHQIAPHSLNPSAALADYSETIRLASNGTSMIDGNTPGVEAWPENGLVMALLNRGYVYRKLGRYLGCGESAWDVQCGNQTRTSGVRMFFPVGVGEGNCFMPHA